MIDLIFIANIKSLFYLFLSFKMIVVRIISKKIDNLIVQSINV